MNLSLTVFEYQDIIDKELNGDISCGNRSQIDSGNDANKRRTTRNALFSSLLKSQNVENEVLVQWNCTHAAKIMTDCMARQENVVNVSLFFTGFIIVNIN